MLPQQLMFTVGLIDQITKPIAKISQQFNGLSSNYQAGTMKMASGVAGVAAAGYALTTAMQPAIEMDRALGEVKSLGVRDSALKKLTDTSYEFALKYGVAADEFVRSGYDIQSSIDGINGKDLSAFTRSSNLLAKATKADAATITDYMGTMFGIFKSDANSMGQTKWVEQLTGMTAQAVKMFKTDGQKMASAFSALGSSAGLAPLQEQMAVLGVLQSTMSGSESATKYKSYMAGVGKAQKALGLSFVDSHGKTLPILDVLGKLQGKFGDLTKQDSIDQVSKAFGSSEAAGLIQALIKETDYLGSSMNKLGKAKGLGDVEKMAAAMTQQSDRLGASWFAIRAAFGTAILPVFNQFAGWLADVGRDLVSFTEQYPTLTEYIGYAAIGLLALVAAGGLFTIMMGAANMAMVAWGVGVIIFENLAAALKVLRAVMLAVNIVMYANPIGLIVAGIAAAVLAVGALIYYWDDLKASMGDVGWIDFLLFPLKAALTLLKGFLNGVMWVVDQVAGFTGLDINLNSSNAIAPSVDAVAPIKSRVENGGITQQISNANQQKSTSIGNVNVYPAKGETNFVEQLEMYG